jgi:PAS domain S-box-containing protein
MRGQWDEGSLRPPWRRYGVAVLLVLLAALLSLALHPWLAPAPLASFIAAVALAAWYGGAAPAVAAIVLSLLPISLVALEPVGAWSLSSRDLVAMAVFVAVSALLVLLSASRDQAEAALRANERRFRTMLATANEGVWQVDPASRTQFANDRMAGLLGTTLEQVQHGSVLDFVFPEDLPSARERIGANLAGQPEVFDFRFRRVDGDEVQVLASTGPVRDASGAVVGALGLFTDITARKRTEEALRTSQERLRLAQEAGGVGVWDWNAATNQTYWSETMWPLYDLEPGSATPSNDLWRLRMHPEDRSRVASSIAHLLDSDASEYRDSFRIPLADGADRWIEVVARVTRNPAGQPVRMTGVNIDITASRQAELALRESDERLRRATEAARIVVWEWEPESDRIVTTDNFAAIYGQPTLDAGAQGISLVHPDDRARHLAIVRRAVAEETGFHAEFRIIRPDSGEIVWLEERAFALPPSSSGGARLLGVAVDVTERKLAEEALRQSEARLAAVLEQLPVAVGLTDDQGRWTLTNALMDRYVGDTLPSRDPDARPRWQAWDEQGQPIPPDAWPGARALRGESVAAMDFLYTASSGEERWVRQSAAPFRDGEGQTIGAIVVVQDIDARRRAEAALRESEARARFLAEASAILAATFDYDEAVQHVVRLAVPRLADWCVIDLLGEDGDLHRLAVIHGDPACAATAEALLASYPTIRQDEHHTAWRVLRSGSPWFDPDVDVDRVTAEARDEQHLAFIRQLGFASELVVPLLGRDHALGVLTLVQGDSGRHFGPEDVPFAEELARHCALAIDNARLYREARAAQAKISRLFDTGVIGLIVADEERILEANDRFLHMLGYSQEDLAAGRLRWPEMTPPGFEAADAQALAELSEQGLCTPFEKEYLHKDGSRVPVLLGAVTVEGKAPPWIGAVVDLTGQKAAERDRVAFIDAATHDLKNPLTSLRGRAQLLLRHIRRVQPPNNETLEAGLEAINTDSNRIVLLIDEMMDAAHLRSGLPLTLQRDDVDLVALAEACVQEAQRRITRHDVRLEAGSPALIGQWDRARLERVLTNLLDNAIKYSPDGGEIVVGVHRRQESREADWAELAVRDHGVGIPAGDLSYVFERFRRGSNVGGIAGSGVGLAGARQIVAQHGGTISVESEAGAGSTFTVRLPLDDATGDGTA